MTPSEKKSKQPPRLDQTVYEGQVDAENDRREIGEKSGWVMVPDSDETWDGPHHPELAVEDRRSLGPLALAVLNDLFHGSAPTA